MLDFICQDLGKYVISEALKVQIMIIEISIACMALASIAAVSYFICVMRDLRRTLQEATELLQELRPEIKKNLESSLALQQSVEEKISALKPLFNAAEQAGEVIEQRAIHFKKESLESSESRATLAATAVVELAKAALSLWKGLRERR